MSQRIKVSSLGFNDLSKEVPSTNEEYNALDPKRENAVLEDAVDNVMKHNVLSRFRTGFLDKAGAVEPKVERINHGDEENPNWESDGKYMKRLMTIRITAAGGNPADASAVAGFYSSNLALAQEVLDSVAFTVAAREGTGSAPTKVGKADLALGQKAVDEGKAEKFAKLLGAKLNRDVPATAEGIAYALKDKRKQEADAAAIAAAAELAELS